MNYWIIKAQLTAIDLDAAQKDLTQSLSPARPG